MTPMFKDFQDRAARRRKEHPITEPTYAQAISHLQKAVVEADRRGVRSPTIEAIRKVVAQPDVPEAQAS